MSSVAMPVTSSDQISTSKIWGVILASSVGTMIEWYDFYIFGLLATFLAPKFYPPGNQLFQYIAYLATFAIGFMVRPFGALFFGRIGDIVGRKYAFIVTLSRSWVAPQPWWEHCLATRQPAGSPLSS